MDVQETTLTFLFTDIEGSTRLWEAYPEAMRLALARHDAILRTSIDEGGGQTFKTMGDAFYAAFASASSALESVIESQRLLRQVDWGELGEIRVRMALYTGAAERRDGDYFGRPLNAAARLLGLAQGGQVLLSATTRVMVEGELPLEAGLRDLGTYRLRGLEGPVRVAQLVHPDLLDDFAPISSDEGLGNLPRELSSFLGRDVELADLDGIVNNAPLVTLTGGGGAGKTRLATQVGERVRHRFRDGVWMVEFAGIRSGASVASEVAATMGVREVAGKSVASVLVDGLKGRDSLLILDNCEHVIADVAALVSEILRGCPRLKVLATSREIMGIAGERTYRVPPMSMPRSDEEDSPESLARFESVRLFVDRAVASAPRFALTATNAHAVAQVCRELDGMPFALELAAARVRAVPVERLAERLGDRFRLLTAGHRTAERRQQTLRGLIDWSYDLLGPEERSLLRTLPAFAGGWDLAAAETVASAVDPSVEAWEILDGLQSLVDKSLVIFDDEVARYRLLETVRQYAWERAEERGELERVRAAHAAWAIDLVADLAPRLNGPGQVEASESIEADHDNLRAAHTFLVESRATDAAQRLVGDLALFWEVRGFLTEGATRCLEALTLGGGTWRQAALLGAGRLLLLHADATTPEVFREALSLAQASGDRRGEAEANHGLANWTFYAKRHEEAEKLFRTAAAIREEIGDEVGAASSIHSLGNFAMRAGRLEEAEAAFEKALAIRRASGDRRGVMMTKGALSQLAMARGDLTAAEGLTKDVIRDVSELRVRWVLALCLSTLFGIALEREDLARAAGLAGTRSRVRELTGFPVPEAERAEEEAVQAALRDRMGAEAYDRAHALGYARSWGGAVAFAQE